MNAIQMTGVTQPTEIHLLGEAELYQVSGGLPALGLGALLLAGGAASLAGVVLGVGAYLVVRAVS